MTMLGRIAVCASSPSLSDPEPGLWLAAPAMPLSGGDLILVYESAEDLFSADPVVGEVDLPRSFVCLSRWELAEGTVRPGSVVVQQVFGQHLAQVVLVDVQKCRSVVPSFPANL